MKNVLIVDDEQSFLLSLTDMLKDNKDKFSIVTAGNGKEAIDIIDKQKVDLVVTDLKMPEVDGFDLLAHISSAKPNVPVIIMTAYGTPEMESRLMDMGAFQYIEKPIDFNTLLHKIKDGLATGTKGQIAGISLPSFLQLLELDKKTCTLNLTSDDRRGEMYFQQGEMIDALTGDLKGLDAAFEMISWDHTEIEIENICRRKKRVIDSPLGFILIESVRKKDEQAEAELNQNASVQTPKEKRPETKQALRDDSSANVDDLDFGFSSSPAEVDLSKVDTQAEVAALAEKVEPKKPAPSPSKSPLELLKDSLINVDGVVRMIAISRDGTVVTQHNTGGKDFGAFVAYVTGASLKLKNILGFTGPQHIILAQPSGEKILIMIGPKLIVGVEGRSDIGPESLIEQLKPVVASAKL